VLVYAADEYQAVHATQALKTRVVRLDRVVVALGRWVRGDLSTIYRRFLTKSSIIVVKAERTSEVGMDARARAISEVIRFYRAQRDWTQEGLAQEAGIAATSVVRLENGEIARPRVTTLKKLADALGIDAHELTSIVAHPSVGLPDEAPVETSVPFTAVYERDGDWWIGYVEELPGANAQERTLDEARQSLREAVRDILEANRELTRTEFEGHEVVREPLSA